MIGDHTFTAQWRKNSTDDTSDDKPTDNGNKKEEKDNKTIEKNTPEVSGKASRVNTGDSNPQIPLIVICVSAGAALLITLILVEMDRRKKQD